MTTSGGAGAPLGGGLSDEGGGALCPPHGFGEPCLGRKSLK